MSASRRPRIESLDVLRGVLAISVMIYHYVLWSDVQISSLVWSALQWVGIYSVEAFFVISGFSMFYVYGDRVLLIPRNAVDFAIKRVFRIAPLYWMCLSITVGYKCVQSFVGNDNTAIVPSTWSVLINMSLLFGVCDPSLSVVVAGWSIGVEMAFYFMFPVLVAICAKGRAASLWLLCLTVVVAAVHERSLLRSDVPLSEQWTSYVHVANHLMFFVGGMSLVHLREVLPRLGHWMCVIICASVVVVSVCIAGSCNEVGGLVTGWRRQGLNVLCLGGCAVVCGYRCREGSIKRIGVFIGDISYSVYLLHVFPFMLLSRSFGVSRSWAVIGSAVLVTVLASVLCHVTLERRFIGLGRRVAVCADGWWARKAGSEAKTASEETATAKCREAA